jgi:hypothetical protein
MNTNQFTEMNATESSGHIQNKKETGNENSTASSVQNVDNVILHEASIITPHPYGVFALCKIFELLQIN